MEIHGSFGFWLTDVETAETRSARLRGLMFRPPVPLLLPTALVHGFWLRAPLWLVGIGADGAVTETRLLARRRLARLYGAHWTLELPLDAPLPRPGERLAFHLRGGEAGADAGTPFRVRHPDRQSGRRFPPPGRDPGRGRRRLRRGHPA